MNRDTEDRESELISRVSQGDEEAFSRLYELTHKRVYNYLYRLLQDKDTAEDIVVETFTEVWKGAGNFKGKSRVTTWIMGIARNLAMNELRKMRRDEGIDHHKYISNCDVRDTEPFDRRRLIKEAMSRLSIKHREIMDLVFFHEMNYREISEVLKIPVNTVKTRVFYAKDALREVLSNMGVTRDDI